MQPGTRQIVELNHRPMVSEKQTGSNKNTFYLKIVFSPELWISDVYFRRSNCFNFVYAYEMAILMGIPNAYLFV